MLWCRTGGGVREFRPKAGMISAPNRTHDSRKDRVFGNDSVVDACVLCGLIFLAITGSSGCEKVYALANYRRAKRSKTIPAELCQPLRKLRGHCVGSYK